jgi:hypothetical protein
MAAAWPPAAVHKFLKTDHFAGQRVSTIEERPADLLLQQPKVDVLKGHHGITRY